jgi:hypothetical protein
MDYKKQYLKVLKENEILKRTLKRKEDVVNDIIHALGIKRNSELVYSLKRINNSELYGILDAINKIRGDKLI